MRGGIWLWVGGAVVGGAALFWVLWNGVGAEPSSAPGGDVSGGGVSPVQVPGADDANALARAVTSEEGDQVELVRIAVAWAVINYANRHGVSPTAAVQKHKDGYHYGDQTGGNYVSSRFEAAPRDRALVDRILAGEIPDPTPGAVQFDSPKTQDWQYAHGQVSKTSAQVADSRRAEGKWEFNLPGVDGYSFRLWVPGSPGGVA